MHNESNNCEPSSMCDISDNLFQIVNILFYTQQIF